jgi:hypothetical protein
VTNDPIVDEVRAVRLAIFAECDYDMKKLLDRLEERQKRHGDRLVTKEEWMRRRTAEQEFRTGD